MRAGIERPKIPAQAAPLADAPDPTRCQREKGLLAGHLVGGQWRFTEQQIADYLRRTEQPLRLYGKRRNDNDQS